MAKSPALAFFGRTSSAFEFCLPTTGPASPQWFHEIKYDGYRLGVERDGDRVRLITRGRYNWTDRTAKPREIFPQP